MAGIPSALAIHSLLYLKEGFALLTSLSFSSICGFTLLLQRAKDLYTSVYLAGLQRSWVFRRTVCRLKIENIYAGIKDIRKSFDGVTILRTST